MMYNMHEVVTSLLYYLSPNGPLLKVLASIDRKRKYCMLLLW